MLPHLVVHSRVGTGQRCGGVLLLWVCHKLPLCSGARAVLNGPPFVTLPQVQDTTYPNSARHPV